MPEPDVVMLGATNLRRRVSKTGKERYTVEVSGDTFAVNVDVKALGRPVADAIAQLFRDRVAQIAAVPAPATLRARASAAKALAAGKAWALRRYAGGKMGAMAPGGDRLFNDSGRMGASFAVGANDEGWVVNVAANRLNPETLDNGGVSALERVFQRLVEFVPELGKPALLGDSLEVRRAVENGVKEAHVKRAAAVEAQVEAAAASARSAVMAQIQILKTIASLVA